MLVTDCNIYISLRDEYSIFRELVVFPVINT